MQCNSMLLLFTVNLALAISQSPNLQSPASPNQSNEMSSYFPGIPLALLCGTCIETCSELWIACEMAWTTGPEGWAVWIHLAIRLHKSLNSLTLGSNVQACIIGEDVFCWDCVLSGCEVGATYDPYVENPLRTHPALFEQALNAHRVFQN